MQEGAIEVRGVSIVIQYVRGSWPWVVVCGGCGGRSPKHRSRGDAQSWAESHVHIWHEINVA